MPIMSQNITSLWSKIEKNTDKIAIQSFTVPRAREWAKWASERTSERSGGRERSEQSGASERVSGASERANGRASGPVLQSVFLAVIDHSAVVRAHAVRGNSIMKKSAFRQFYKLHRCSGPRSNVFTTRNKWKQTKKLYGAIDAFRLKMTGMVG